MSSPVSEAAVRLPAPVLRPFISRYAGFRACGLPPGVHLGLPSSCIDLILSLGDPIEVAKMPNSAQRPSAFTALVSGLQDAPAIVRRGTDAFGLHVWVKPLGLRAILGVASAELSSLVVNLSDLWGNRAADLMDALLAASTWQQRFDALDRAFVAKLRPFSTRPEVVWAWRRLEQAHGSVPIEVLADGTGYSRRHFRDGFREATGVTPKSAARVFRFERACRLLAERRRLADVAIDCGYYDQAHLTREWKALAGCSPRAWMAHELPFIQDYEIGGRDNESDDLESVHQSFVRRPV